MKEEIVNQVIDRLSVGNSNLALVMRLVYGEGRSCVDKWGDGEKDLCARRFVRVVSNLIHQRIDINTLNENPIGYWQTEPGSKAGKVLSEFVEKRKIVKKMDNGV